MNLTMIQAANLIRKIAPQKFTPYTNYWRKIKSRSYLHTQKNVEGCFPMNNACAFSLRLRSCWDYRSAINPTKWLLFESSDDAKHVKFQ
mmetsp:Transcript_24850/g.59877  ORF Transcript_24850/g.59877 Transcript_24850/m.59877 type:complete len:89 (-) Transcript_24850:387-653(-)